MTSPVGPVIWEPLPFSLLFPIWFLKPCSLRLMLAYFDCRSRRNIHKSAEHSKKDKHIKQKRKSKLNLLFISR